MVNVTDVLAVDVPDEPGGLARVLEAFERAGLGVEYLYAFAGERERGRRATLVFRVEEPERASQLLSREGVKLVPSEELFARAGG